ncbi:MAG: carboxypeptidase regulatory-like domain-containing protein [bacterium]
MKSIFRKTISINRAVFFSVFIFISNSLFARPSGQITGRILDASSGLSLRSVTVFISGTMRATQSDEQGNYVFENVQAGAYTLVFFMEKYELTILNIRLTEPETDMVNVRLQPAPVQALEHSDMMRNRSEWERNCGTFERLLFGPTQNTRKCRILNPDVLNFQIDERNQEFRVRAAKPLRIENQALGYLIEMYLEEFATRNDVIVRFQYQSKFDSIPPQSKNQMEEWMKNRRRAYRGSLAHFIASLASDRLKEEGYLISTEYRVSRYEVNEYFNQIPVESILSPGEFLHEKRLSFPQYLRVVYTREDEDVEYVRDELVTRATGQRSWLRMNTTSVIINTQGSIENPYALSAYGYMAWERFAEAVPLEFIQEMQSEHGEPTEASETDMIPKEDVVFPSLSEQSFRGTGISLCVGSFFPNFIKLKQQFGAIPMIQAILYGEYTRFLGLVTLSYGFKKSKSNTVFVKHYSLPRIQHFSNPSLHLCILSFDLLFRFNREGRFRFMAGPGLLASQVFFRGGRMKNLAGGQIYGDEILDDEIASGIGAEFVVGFHCLFQKVDIQCYMKYLSKVFYGHTYFNYDVVFDNEVPRYRYFYDTGGFQFNIGIGLHR